MCLSLLKEMSRWISVTLVWIHPSWFWWRHRMVCRVCSDGRNASQPNSTPVWPDSWTQVRIPILDNFVLSIILFYASIHFSSIRTYRTGHYSYHTGQNSHSKALIANRHILSVNTGFSFWDVWVSEQGFSTILDFSYQLHMIATGSGWLIFESMKNVTFSVGRQNPQSSQLFEMTFHGSGNRNSVFCRK